jgi:DNA-nicking Smr family endonuclease
MSNNQKDDDTSFRDAMSDVIPLNHDQVVHDKPKPAPIPRQTIADEKQVLVDMLSDEYEPEDMQPGDQLSYCRTGIQKSIFRKLRRGKYRISDELDLHGLNSQQARELLAQYLKNVKQLESCCVRVIHGKGNRSSNAGPVLKKKVNHWLRQHDRVLAFHSAMPVDGGTGAVYVLLKRQ